MSDMLNRDHSADSVAEKGVRGFDLQSVGTSVRGLVIPELREDQANKDDEARSRQAKEATTAGNIATSGEKVEPILRWTCLGKTLTITKHDMASLAPATYINDNVVHFGIRYLLTAPTPFGDGPGLNRARWEDVVAMDSLWFTEIQKRWQATPREAAWFSTSFTKNVDIFQRPYLIVPINDSSHWNLILVINPGFLLNPPAATDTSPVSASNTSEPCGPPDRPVGRPPKRQRTNEGPSDGLHGLPFRAHGRPQSKPALVLPPGVGPSEFERWLPSRDSFQGLFPVERPKGHNEANVAPRPSPTNPTRTPFFPNRPTLISLDSMVSYSDPHLMLVTEFLRNEAALKKRSELEAAGVAWDDNVVGSKSRALRKLSVNKIRAVVPIQPNGYDCGPFMLHFIRRVFSDPQTYIQLIVDEYMRGRTPGIKMTADRLWDCDQAERARVDWTRELNRLAEEWEKEGAMRDDTSRGYCEDNKMKSSEVRKAP